NTGSTYGQALNRNLGDIIVRFSDDRAAAGFLDNSLREIHSKDQQVTIKRLARQFPIYLIHVDHTTVNDIALLEEIRESALVSNAQLNHRLSLRNKIPNDPEITQQWYWINQGQFGGTENADVDADLAWEYTTGGVTPQGDSIVIAIVDDGIQFGHIDLQENLWTNRREVPDNGLDDDGNGYIDDYHGWNINNNGEIGDGQHGISVAGVAGAVGNNNLGISGINWQVKIMAVTLNFPNINEADVLTAYSYILDQRTAYNESQGKEGAFIVAVNSSWGIDRGRPRDAPLWCDFYDAMGAAGILNCAATATNANINVDRDGDLPTTCPSEFLISVTASDLHDGLASGAGFGPNHVDVAAPGVDIITTGFNNSFVLESGTSYSSPLVAGLIGLMYSTPCASLTQNSTSDPMGTAAAIRDLIYSGTERLESFTGLVRMNGRINAYNSMLQALINCASCAPPFKLAGEVSDTSATLFWE
ncbi:MAG: S8 family serine peptidase, partial [Saprospiraceae bacterium]|nr:S8 family serine peptidase [Saprospiraceae bacterium]